MLASWVTLRHWSVEYELDRQHLSRALKASGLTDARRVATQRSMSDARRQNGTSPGRKQETEAGTSTPFDFVSMDKQDVLCSVKELLRKMASPRSHDLTALKGVACFGLVWLVWIVFCRQKANVGCVTWFHCVCMLLKVVQVSQMVPIVLTVFQEFCGNGLSQDWIILFQVT